MGKIIARNSLKKKCRILSGEGKKIVFTNGCFDLLHPGHMQILKFARSKGDILIVGLNSDSSIHKIKGINRPILDQKARAANLSAVCYVDFVTIFDEPTPLELISFIRPQILVKGGDWDSDQIIGRDLVQKVFRVPLVKGYSTTAIIKKILNTCAK